MKRSKKVMALVLALSMILASGTLAFADVEDDANASITDTNTAADTSADEAMPADADEVTKEDAEVPGESTEGKTGEEAGEVCEHDYIFSKFILCAVPVMKVSKCSKCGAEKVEEDSTISPIEHFVWDETKVEIRSRTCDQDQLLEGNCIFCNETVKITGEKAGHRLDNGYVSKMPTATTEGEYTKTCTECSYVEKDTIRKLTSEDEKVQVNVTIRMYEAEKNPYGPGYVSGKTLGKSPTDTKEFSNYIEPFGSYELNLTELLGRNVRTTSSVISGVKHGGLERISTDQFSFDEERIVGTVGLPDLEKIEIKLDVMTWHNFTQIRCYFQQPDGSWAMKTDAAGKAVGLRYEDTIKDEAVAYTPEQFNGYEYLKCDIGYFHNLGSTTGPGIVKEVVLTEDEKEEWGLEVSAEGNVTGQNVDFFANKQLFIAYYYALPFAVNYNLAGGNINGNETVEPATFKMQEEVMVQPNPTRSGYTFRGWTVTADNGQPAPEISADGKFTMPAANVTLTANWEPVPYIPPYNPPTIDPVVPVDPVNPQPLPPDDPLEDPDKPVVEPQPLPPDDPLIEEDPKQPLPEDEHLIDPTDAEKEADPDQPKTGDEAPLMALTGLFLAAAGALGAIYIRRRTEK